MFFIRPPCTVIIDAVAVDDDQIAVGDLGRECTEQSNSASFLIEVCAITARLGSESYSNIEGVVTAQYNTINAYDILNCDKLVVARSAAEKIEEVYAK